MALNPAANRLTNRYSQALRRLSVGTAAFVGAAWRNNEGLNDDTAAHFAGEVSPFVVAAQTRAVSVTDAYLGAFLTLEMRESVLPRGIDPSEFVGAAARGGMVGEELWRRPVISVRAAIARGQDYAAARAEGLARALATSSSEVQLSARAASKAVLEGDDRVNGYRRVLSGKSCPLCRSHASKRYRRSELMPIHPHCNCVSEPLVGTQRPPKAVVTEGIESKVVQHSELGPMLWQSDHDFAALT